MPLEQVTARFVVSHLNHMEHQNGTQSSVVLNAISTGYGEAHNSYSKYTPSGKIEMMITNPPALEFFKPGQIVNLTFTHYTPE